jgi:hypothetical protein
MHTCSAIFLIFVAAKVQKNYENTNYQRPQLKFIGCS